jgi:hypothetical protein|tara:strand:- start:880 stop:1071 length:192 start_codon:yes stop_codon:yes gene_type:complete
MKPYLWLRGYRQIAAKKKKDRIEALREAIAEIYLKATVKKGLLHNKLAKMADAALKKDNKESI